MNSEPMHTSGLNDVREFLNLQIPIQFRSLPNKFSDLQHSESQINFEVQYGTVCSEAIKSHALKFIRDRNVGL